MAMKSSILCGLIVTLFIALGSNMENVEARDVKLVHLNDVKPETLKTLKVEEEEELLQGKARENVIKEIEKAKSMLVELKTMKKQAKGEDMKKELDSLVKSESLLDDILGSIKNESYNSNKANIFIEKESFFYRAWKENTYDSAVPEKEKEFMFTIKRIIKLLKKT